MLNIWSMLWNAWSLHPTHHRASNSRISYLQWAEHKSVSRKMRFYFMWKVNISSKTISNRLGYLYLAIQLPEKLSTKKACQIFYFWALNSICSTSVTHVWSSIHKLNFCTCDLNFLECEIVILFSALRYYELPGPTMYPNLQWDPVLVSHAFSSKPSR